MSSSNCLMAWLAMGLSLSLTYIYGGLLTFAPLNLREQ